MIELLCSTSDSDINFFKHVLIHFKYSFLPSPEMCYGGFLMTSFFLEVYRHPCIFRPHSCSSILGIVLVKPHLTMDGIEVCFNFFSCNLKFNVKQGVSYGTYLYFMIVFNLLLGFFIVSVC